jgi:hypothetical protein
LLRKDYPYYSDFECQDNVFIKIIQIRIILFRIIYYFNQFFAKSVISDRLEKCCFT